MKIRLLNALLVAGLLLAPMAASAVSITININGALRDGLGTCSAAPSGCTDPINIPPGSDGNGLFDQVTLNPFSTVVDSAVGTAVISQSLVFNPGDTGAGSDGFQDFFNLNRDASISDGITTIHKTLLQSGDLLVGMNADTLSIYASTPLVFILSDLNPSLTGTLTLSLGAFSLTAGIDPPGDIPGEINVNAVPTPSTLALFAVGLAGFSSARRQTA
jgi:hypothetical protein